MWNPRWTREGKDPDYRFTLANERTFLAWIRTALAVLAGGVILDQFATRLASPAVLVTVAVGLVALSALLCISAYLRWRGNEIAMRHGRGLPENISVPLTTGAALVVAAVLASLLLLH
ncbi:MAG TPA: DUF202 domain-containing protein [Casimicrobiaceae bacterium]|nr:DUF202 domain-containing protein [Casimicrobiaceae bacterium]